MTEKVREIGLEESLSLEMAGKAIFVWVLGAVDTRLIAETLGISEDKLSVFSPDELVASPDLKRLFGGKIPIFVCRHGNTSKVVAAKMMERGVGCYSLEGGVTRYNPSLEGVV